MAVYSYLRVSTNQQVDSGIGLDVQRRMVGGYLTMLGLDLAAEFVEGAVSGSVPFAERPQGRVLAGLLQTGDVLVAAKLDRMFRSASDALEVLAAMKANRVSLHLLDLGGDLMNGMGKFMFTIVAAFAEQERDRIRDRALETKAHQRARGEYLGGRVPFGYRVVIGPDGTTKMLEEDPRQQFIIREIRGLGGKGYSLRKIKDRLGLALSLDLISRICDERE
jgi:DNA invertase Pin-like site-specific DNA recombinase